MEYANLLTNLLNFRKNPTFLVIFVQKTTNYYLPMKTFLISLLALGAALSATAQPLAFPGAEGFGKYTTGGRGGRVMIVTNLDDHGPGSLREAVEGSGPRIVVFEVDGDIHLETPLRIENDDITIAGQSAPGDGICLCDSQLTIDASNVIIRYIRCRLGDKYTHDSDAVGGGRYGQKNVILDHISASWSIDECFSIYKTENLTVQWCLIACSLRASKHTKGQHGFGGIWGGLNATFHHNLLAHHSSRNPRFSSVEGTENVDYRGNVVYNWGFMPAYGGGRGGKINFCYNYYKAGPGTDHPDHILNVSDDGTSRYFVQGNYVDGQPAATADNRLAVGGKNPEVAVVDTEFPRMDFPLEAEPAALLKSVLKGAGCSHRRDVFDKAVVQQVRKGTAPWGDRGFVNSPDECGGWPVLRHRAPRPDHNRNGIPDALEHKYPDIEDYLNSLVN